MSGFRDWICFHIPLHRDELQDLVFESFVFVFITCCCCVYSLHQWFNLVWCNSSLENPRSRRRVESEIDHYFTSWAASECTNTRFRNDEKWPWQQLSSQCRRVEDVTRGDVGESVRGCQINVEKLPVSRDLVNSCTDLCFYPRCTSERDESTL